MIGGCRPIADSAISLFYESSQEVSCYLLKKTLLFKKPPQSGLVFFGGD